MLHAHSTVTTHTELRFSTSQKYFQKEVPKACQCVDVPTYYQLQGSLNWISLSWSSPAKRLHAAHPLLLHYRASAGSLSDAKRVYLHLKESLFNYTNISHLFSLTFSF